LISVTDRKTTAEHKLAMSKRELAERTRAAEKLKLVKRCLFQHLEIVHFIRIFKPGGSLGF
jgi:hypothetical protein